MTESGGGQGKTYRELKERRHWVKRKPVKGTRGGRKEDRGKKRSDGKESEVGRITYPQV